MKKEHEDILNFVKKELKDIAEGMFYRDKSELNELCIYVIVREHFNKFYNKILGLEETINKKYTFPVSMHIWASQGRPLDKCRPPGTQQWK